MYLAEVGQERPPFTEGTDITRRMEMKKLDRPVLAEGETTGHAHVLEEAGVEVWEAEDGHRETVLDKPSVLRHEEHKPVTLPAGEWCSDIVRETDPFEGERRVLD